MGWPIEASDLAEQASIYLLGTDHAKPVVDHAMLSRFRAHDDRNIAAARSAERFLTTHAPDDRTTHTRVFVVDDEVVAYYAMSVGEALLTGRQRRSLGARAASSRIPTAHVDWIARDGRAPAGTGIKALQHAVAVVSDDLKPVTPILALSLDPFDAETARAWEQLGFKATSTKIDGAQARMFLPLTGYGSVGLAA